MSPAPTEPTGAHEPLAGRVIAVAETRELDVFAALLERRGARVLRYPLVQHHRCARSGAGAGVESRSSPRAASMI